MNPAQSQVVIIGAGFSSLSAACYLAQAGYEVTVLEKNEQIGGRARQYKEAGFTFDMGPTFYWMPDVFEAFFADFGHSVSDFYALEKLNPAYEIYFGTQEKLSIPDQLEGIIKVFESIEPGSGKKLRKFIAQAEDNYNVAIQDLVYQPGESLFEIMNLQTLKKLNLFFDTIKKQVRRAFKHPWLQKTLEFPVLFLGATSANTPAFYNFMNYADFGLGTWHPTGGMYAVITAMEQLAKKLGVTIKTNAEVVAIQTTNNRVTSVTTATENYPCDILLSGADYAYTEQLLPPHQRQYSDSYWSSRAFAPSALMFYVGFKQSIDHVAHHTLFFDVDFDRHASAIYETGELPEEPLFYASFPSKTDASVAPDGKEAGIFLIPLAPDSKDTPALRAQYFEQIIARLEKVTQQSIREHILFYKDFGVNDFKSDYHACQGNAYGLANTLLQTHILRPRLHSKKLLNLYFTGQLTIPGPGVPPSIISGKIVSDLILQA